MQQRGGAFVIAQHVQHALYRREEEEEAVRTQGCVCVLYSWDFGVVVCGPGDGRGSKVAAAAAGDMLLYLVGVLPML